MMQDKRSEQRHEKIAVVGGAGYVGAHMVTLLQDDGYEVVVLDNLSRGVPNATSTEFYNLANGFSILEVINICRQVTGQDIRFTVQTRRTGDPTVLVGDASQTLKILAWSPQIPALEDIIASAWNWVVQHDRQLELVAQGK